jgi:hypothetical protein
MELIKLNLTNLNKIKAGDLLINTDTCEFFFADNEHIKLLKSFASMQNIKYLSNFIQLKKNTNFHLLKKSKIKDFETVYSYDDILDVVEKFMTDSGIRKWCSDHCKTKCCEGCYKSDQACHKNEGRRLTCSLYLCGSIVHRCSGIAHNNLLNKFKTLDTFHVLVKDIIRKVSRRDPYFKVHTPEIKKLINFPKYFVELYIPNESDTLKIKEVIDKKIQCKNNEIKKESEKNMGWGI